MNQLFRTSIASLAIFVSACDAEDRKPANTPKPAAKDTTVKTEDLSKLSKEELAKKLDPEAYRVCIMGGTERPFANKYWNNHDEGIYVDVISGKPLFASTTKFDSRSGWPAFFDPIDKAEIIEKTDYEIGYKRTEVVAKSSGAHLGHVFDDGFDYATGKATPNGMRYCINSAALKFVAKDKLKEAGLEKYAHLFEGKSKKEGGK